MPSRLLQKLPYDALVELQLNNNQVPSSWCLVCVASSWSSFVDLFLFFFILFIPLYFGGPRQLLALPSQLGKLVRLQVLSVRNNALIALPSEATKLKALQELDLYSNKIAKLPSSLGKYVDHGLAYILLPHF